MAIKKWELLLLFVLFLSACTLGGQTTPKGVLSSGLIITPPSYYSTQKARALGERYRQHLEQLVQELVDNPVTGKLQFANNIASVGGIGFFTHSASTAPDERYLEVVLGVPDVFDAAVDLNSKVDELFSLYGPELLAILAGDENIYRDKDVAGYGLNLSWRTTSGVSGRRRVALERAVIYVSKQEARRFLDRQDSQSLLAASVIYAIGTDGLPRRFAYGRPEPGRDRPVVVSKEGSVEKRSKFSSVELTPDILEQELSAEKQPEQPPTQAVFEKSSPGIAPKEAEPDKEEIAGKARAEKAGPKPESVPERREKVAEKGAEVRKELAKAPSAPVETAKRAAPPEPKVKPKLVLEEETSKQPEGSEAKATHKASMPKATAGPKSVPERPKGVVKKTSDIPERSVKMPSAPVGVTKRAVPPEKQAEAELASKEETPKRPEPSAQESRNKAKTDKPALDEESEPEQPKKVTKRAPEAPKEAIKESSPEVEVAKRMQPPEKKVKPELAPKNKTLEQAGGEIEERAGTATEENAVPEPENTTGGREKAVKTMPDAQEEAVKEPSAPVEIAKRTAPPEEKAPPELEIKKEIPGAVEEKLPEARPLEGYLVQFVFSERAKAEQWSKLLNQEGYATTMNMIRGNQAVRLRAGPFPSAMEAGRLLEKRQRQGLTGMVIFHVPGSQSSPAMKKAAKKPGMALPEKTAMERAEASEEKEMEQPKTGGGDGKAVVSRAVRKELPDVKPPQPKADMKLPEEKKEAEEKTEPKVVLKKRVPEAVEGKQPAGELPKIQTIHGYLVQVSFLDVREAQRWSEALTREGYSTSMTRIRGKQSVRLRIGAFPSSAEAQGLLKKLQKEGLTGFIVQAPR